VFHALLFVGIGLSQLRHPTAATANPLFLELSSLAVDAVATGAASSEPVATPTRPSAHARKTPAVSSAKTTELPVANSAPKDIVATATGSEDFGAADSEVAAVHDATAATSTFSATKSAGHASSFGDGAGKPVVNIQGMTQGYLGQLQRFLHRGIQYPLAARQAKLQGVVYLSITIDARGHIQNVEVQRSSGHQVLDYAAVQVLRKLPAVPAPPLALQWRTRSVTLPIVYRFT